MAGIGRSDPAWRALVALVAGAVVAAGCSLIVDQAASQCVTDGDCARFAGTACQQGACVAREAGPGDDGAAPADVVIEIPPVTACTSTQDCLPDHQGANWICRKSDATCVRVTSQDCPGPIAGDYKSDDVVLVGALMPLAGPYASIGSALDDTLRLAANDFSMGLPPPTRAATRVRSPSSCATSPTTSRAPRATSGTICTYRSSSARPSAPRPWRSRGASRPTRPQVSPRRS